MIGALLARLAALERIVGQFAIRLAAMEQRIAALEQSQQNRWNQI
jgi:hypothetical protein